MDLDSIVHRSFCARCYLPLLQRMAFDNSRFERSPWSCSNLLDCRNYRNNNLHTYARNWRNLPKLCNRKCNSLKSSCSIECHGKCRRQIKFRRRRNNLDNCNRNGLNRYNHNHRSWNRTFRSITTTAFITKTETSVRQYSPFTFRRSRSRLHKQKLESRNSPCSFHDNSIYLRSISCKFGRNSCSCRNFNRTWLCKIDV